MSVQKRKIKLINRDFQYRLMAKFIFIYGAMVIIFGALLYVFFDSEISANLFSAHVSYRSVSQMLMPIFITLTVLNMIITGVMIVLVVLRSSHKIAGPLFRFNEALKAIADRNLKPITSIRDDDQLKDISTTLGRVTDTLGEDISQLKRKISQLSELCTASGRDMPEPVKTKMEEIKSITDKYSNLE